MYLTTTNKLIIVLAVLVLLMAIFVSSRPHQCANYRCFQERMSQCKTASFISEEQTAAYQYFVRGKVQGQCEVDVTLLLAKEGPLRLDELEGLSMSCIYPLGFSGIPGKELSSCTGPLKEGMQSKIITSLQEYVVDNLDQIGG